jgi:high-affinity nickel permease
MQGAFWDTIGSLDDNSSTIGLIVIDVMIASRVLSIIIYFLNRFDKIEVNSVR